MHYNGHFNGPFFQVRAHSNRAGRHGTGDACSAHELNTEGRASHQARQAAHEDRESLTESVRSLRREIRELREQFHQSRPSG